MHEYLVYTGGYFALVVAFWYDSCETIWIFYSYPKGFTAFDYLHTAS